MSQTNLFQDAEDQAKAADLRARAEAIHRKADVEYDDEVRRGNLRVKACALEVEADELVPVEYAR
jgi:hypothetical protein